MNSLSLMMRIWQFIKAHTLSSATFVTICISLSVFSTAYWMRIPTVYFALPYIPHVDESYLMNLAYKGLREHIWFPLSFWRPHLNFYTAMLAIIVDSKIHGFDWSILPVASDRITTPITPFIAVRTFYIALGAATVVIAYYWAARMLPRWVALLTGLTIAFASYHITFSGLITPEVLTCLGCTTFLYVTSIYEKYPQRRYLYLLAFIAGVTTSAKYNFIALFVVLCFVVWRGMPRYRSWAILIQCGLITAIGFFLFTPSILINFQTFVHSFSEEFNSYQGTTKVINSYSGRFPFGLYLDFFTYTIFTPSIICAFVLGLTQIRKQQISLQAAVLLLFFQFSFFFSANIHYPRNFIFFIPAAVIICFTGIYNVFVQLKQEAPQLVRWLTVCQVTVYLLVMLPAMISGYNIRTYFSQPYSLNVVDAALAESTPPAIIVGDVEPTLLAERPWVVSKRLHTNDDIALWQAGGIGQLVINNKLFPKPKPQYILAHRHINGDKDGASGFPYDIYYTDARRALQAIGRPMRTTLGADILGVRIGRGDLRASVTPLSNIPHVKNTAAPLLLNIYLHVKSPPTNPDALLFVHLFDDAQQKVAQRNAPPVDYYPMSKWRSGDFIIAMADLPVDALPPGTYHLVIGFYDAAIDKRLPVIGSLDGTYTVTFTVDK
jgi:hypothetical protein